MANHRIFKLPNPELNSEPVTKEYADTHYSGGGSGAKGDKGDAARRDLKDQQDQQDLKVRRYGFTRIKKRQRTTRFKG